MCYSKLKWRKFKPSDKFLDTISGLNTVTKLVNYLEDNMTYQWDKPGFFGDHWKTPEETLNDGGGDCEDVAIFNLYVLTEVIKKEAYMVNYAGYFLDKKRNKAKNGHAVCIFNDIGKKGIFSNNELTYENKSYEAIGYRWYPLGLNYMEVIDNNGKTIKLRLPKYLFWGTF